MKIGPFFILPSGHTAFRPSVIVFMCVLSVRGKVVGSERELDVVVVVVVVAVNVCL